MRPILAKLQVIAGVEKRIEEELIFDGDKSVLSEMKKRTENGGEEEASHRKMIMSSISAMIAESVTFPIDMTKTRLQLHSSSHSSTNAFRVVSEIVQEQGPLALYKGLSPAIIRHLFYTPTRIVGYENLRNLCLPDHGGDGPSLSFFTKALLGGFSGAIAQVLMFFLHLAFYISELYTANLRIVYSLRAMCLHRSRVSGLVFY